MGMTTNEAIEILISVAVCDRPILSCDFCARYAGIGTHCNYPTDEEIEEAVLLLKGASKDMAISALRQQEPNDWICTLKCTALMDEGMCSHGGLCCLYESQRTIKENQPLTLDELRKMPIRDWVWIEILNPDAFRSKETVSAYYRKYDGYKKAEIFWCGYPGLGFGFDYADYGKTWLAYRQKPEERTT